LWVGEDQVDAGSEGEGAGGGEELSADFAACGFQGCMVEDVGTDASDVEFGEGGGVRVAEVVDDEGAA
jgi:hypothetical protein